MSKKQDLNIKRYQDTITVSSQTLTSMRKCLKLPFGKKLYRIREDIRHFLICGFMHNGKINDKYHLYCKLCRYEDWKEVKINIWDRARFKFITGYKFEK